MSYESKMLEKLAMPTKKQVEHALLRALFRHGGVVKEFGSGEEIVDELADEFNLSKNQRTAALETIYRKENRVKKSPVWHRLLFRAADNIAKENLATRPTKTILLTNKREWMLTEKGFDEALRLSGVPAERKEDLPIKSYEVQKIVNKLTAAPIPFDYDPFDKNRKITKITKETTLRARGFRQAVIESYSCKCAICGLKLASPDFLSWEVEAAHIVPHSFLGKDDIWNGIAFCHLHHWAFDVGWFTLNDNYSIHTSKQFIDIPHDFGKMGESDIFKMYLQENSKILLPDSSKHFPHHTALQWHRQNIFHQ